MGVISQFRGLPRQVYLLSFVRIVMSLGSFVFPFLSLLLTSQLGFNEFQVGLVMVIVSAGNIIGSFGGGKLGDLLGRKKVFVVSTVVATVMAFLAGWCCPSPLMLPFILVSYFASSMVAPVVAAMITDYSDDSNRAECFSLLYLSQNIGYAVGPTIGGMMFYSHMPWIFFGEAIMFTIVVALFIPLVQDAYQPLTREQRRAAKAALREQKQEEKTEQNTFRLLMHMPILLGFIVCLALLSACYQEISFVLPLQFQDLCGLEVGSRYAGYIWTANGLTIVFATPIIIALSKRRNQLLNVLFACFLYAVGFGLNGIIQHPMGLLAVAVIWSSGEILISTGSGVFIASYSPETHKARFQSLYEVARGVGRGIGPTLCGLYLLTHNYAQAWRLVAIVCVVISGVVYLLYLAEQSEKRAKEMQKKEAA